MARQARYRSELKVYHAILRGVNKQQIGVHPEPVEVKTTMSHRQMEIYRSGVRDYLDDSY